MSFETVLQAAVLSSLASDPDLAGASNGVFLEQPVRATPPYLTFGPLLSTDWGAKALAGREVRLLIQVRDEGESWTRTVELQGMAARAIESLPRSLGAWRLGSVVLLRARTVKDGTNGWLGTVEHRVRAMEV